MRPATGFTLIELVLVLLLTGALAVVATPSFFSRGGFDEYAYVKDLLAATRYAQKLALATGCDVRIDIQPSQYALYYRAGGSATACGTGAFTEAVANPFADGAGYAAAAAPGVSAAAPLVRHFDGQGRPFIEASPPTPAGGSVSFAGATITIEADTGYAHD